MEKLVSVVAGLVGVVLSFTSGCMHQANTSSYVYQANEDVNKIRNYHKAIKKIIGADPNDSYHIFEPIRKGRPFRVYIIEKNGTIKIRKYDDIDGDGIFEKTAPPRKTEIFKNFDIRISPPSNPNLEKYKNDYLPKKKEKRMVVFRY